MSFESCGPGVAKPFTQDTTVGVEEPNEDLLEKVAHQVGLEGQLGWETQRRSKRPRSECTGLLHLG